MQLKEMVNWGKTINKTVQKEAKGRRGGTEQIIDMNE